MDSRFDFIEQLNHHAEDISKNFKVDEPVNLDSLFNPNPPRRTAEQEKYIEFFEDLDPINKSDVNKRIFEKNADLLRGGISIIMPETLPDNAINAFQRAALLKTQAQDRQKNITTKPITKKLKNKNWLENNRKEKLRKLKCELEKHENFIEEFWKSIELEQRAVELCKTQWLHEIHQEIIWFKRHSITLKYQYGHYFIDAIEEQIAKAHSGLKRLIFNKFADNTDYEEKISVPELIKVLSSFLFVWRNSIKLDPETLILPEEKTLAAYLKKHPIYFMHDAKSLFSKYLAFRFNGIALSGINGLSLELENAPEQKSTPIVVKNKQLDYEQRLESPSDNENGSKNTLDKKDDLHLFNQMDAGEASPINSPFATRSLPLSQTQVKTTSEINPPTQNIFQRIISWFKKAVSCLFYKETINEDQPSPQSPPVFRSNIFDLMGIRPPTFTDREKYYETSPQDSAAAEQRRVTFDPPAPERQVMDGSIRMGR